ncbi:MAG: O-antigen ligase family protein [Thermoleophilia bacterium]|nr:O-antigen ligase family protein [Thermoleophilia bacterium]
MIVAADPGGAAAALRRPALLALLALAALTAASAAWTVGEPDDALRWGAVLGGFAALWICGSAVAGRLGAGAVARFVLALAVAAALLGLAGAALQELPYAERIGGSWRPGGPLEYGPALGTLQLAGMPLALTWAASERRSRAAAGAAACAVAAAAIALVSSRAVLALGGLLLLLIAADPTRTIGRRRPLAIALVCFTLTAGLAADAVAGSYAEPYASTPDWPRVVGLLLVLVLAPALWSLTRSRFADSGRPLAGQRAAAMTLVTLPLLAAAVAAAATPDAGTGVEPDAGLTHGRVEIWRDAVEAVADGPLAGTGALTFLQTRIVAGEDPGTRFAHDLPVEAWVELGYPGLILTVGFLAAVAALIDAARGRSALWLLGPGAVAFLLAALIDWQWHIPAAGAISAFLLGGLAGSEPDEQRSHRDGRR